MKVKNYFWQMLNQFIPVVLGVYLGIVASNWNEDRAQKAQQKDLISNLYLEVQANKSKLKETLAYRETILSSARKVRKELDTKTMESKFWLVGHWTLLPGWQGTKIPTLESSVYQSGMMGNTISGLDFKIINSIARSYNYQEDYKALAQRLVFDNLQFENDIKTGEALSKIEIWYDVISKEKELINQYDQTLHELEKLENE